MSPATPGLPETCPVCVVIPCPFHAAASDVLAALELVTNRLVGLILGGDGGFWDPEGEECVKAARAAIAKVRGD